MTIFAHTPAAFREAEAEALFAECRRGWRYTQLRPFDWRPLRLWKLWFVVMGVLGRWNARLCRRFGLPVRRRILPRPKWRTPWIWSRK